MMRENRHFAWCVALVVAVTLLMTAGPGRAGVAESQGSPQERELKLISVLQSDAPTAEKAITCKRLAIYGTQEAVPALAPLLADEDLSSWARIALEAIPGPAAEGALREALGKVQGNLLIGVINSIAYRRDARAIDGLAERLKDSNSAVASAAAVALGCIGGDQAASCLEKSLADGSAEVRPAVAEGCIRCAEKYLAAGKAAEAKKLYDAVCVADVPKQRVLDATRGAILARGSAGVSFLVAQLESSDKGRLGIGLRTARELPGRDVTEALAAELDRLHADRQPLLLLALADRRDAAVLPAVLKAAQCDRNKLRITAVDLLARLGDVSCTPVLLAAATESDAELSQAAKATLARLPGKDVDADLLARLRGMGFQPMNHRQDADATKNRGQDARDTQGQGVPNASVRVGEPHDALATKTRQTLIELAGQRQIAGALPAIMGSVEDADAGVRSAAVQAIGVMGESKHAADLVRLAQKTHSPQERGDIEKALLAVSGRWKAECVPHLMPLMQSSDGTLRMVGLRAMAIVGGPDALAVVKSAIDDKDEAFQDEAVRTLSTWPNNWPEDAAAAEVLLTLAKSGKKMSHQVLGLRGYLQYVQRDKGLRGSEKVAKINEVLPLAKRPEEKRLAISVLGGTPAPGSLESLMTLAADPAVAEEACSAILGLTGRNTRGLSREQRQKALRVVVEKSRNDATRKRAEDLLK